GYHASLMYQEIGNSEDSKLFDFIVRGEGEITFNQLVQELASDKRNFSTIQGLSFKQSGTFHHNLPAPLLDLEQIKLPNRDCRIFNNFKFMKMKFDCAETSRGCTLPCNFCSITQMYGRSFRLYSFERIIKDLKNLQARGVKGVFFVDDNITLHVKRLKELCKVMVQEKVNDIYYITQASVPGIAADPELAGWLREAGFRLVFMGIESGIERNLKEMHKKGVLQNTRKAVSLLRDEGICVLGGFIIGNPKDDRQDIKSTYDYAFDIGVDHAIVQCMTPYPKTEVREKLLTQGFITNKEDLTRYTGFICNVRTEFLTTEELTKWMILYGMRLYFNPRYILRNRLWWHHPRNAHHMLINNFKFVVEGLRGKLFYSRHSW
ncbi:MAG: B12-binding domain-containing radical SAM protein, partial [Nitrospira sp.]|nr:B12-binding domain-containing radical SAM protein [Nitrospira sp.]